MRSKDAERGVACIWAACADCTLIGVAYTGTGYMHVMSRAALLSPFFHEVNIKKLLRSRDTSSVCVPVPAQQIAVLYKLCKANQPSSRALSLHTYIYAL